MVDQRIEKMAKLCVQYSVDVKPNEQVMIERSEQARATNSGITRFTKNMLFEEKMGGTIHMALDLSYPESGGQSKSTVHWDILKDMKNEAEVYVDDKHFYKNGKFLD
jgi:aminopeptidase